MPKYMIPLNPAMQREVDKMEWDLYEVKKSFHLGEIDDKIGRGETLQVNDKFVFIRDEYLFKRSVFHSFFKKGWITPLFSASNEEEQEEYQAVETFERPSNDKARVAASLLPKGWDGLHWKKKLKQVEEIQNLSMLQNILTVEKAPAVVNAVKTRISDLGDL